MNQSSTPEFISQLMDAWNSHDAERAASFYGATYRGFDVAMPRPQIGPDGMRETLSMYWSAFPDLQFSADDALLDGNTIALFWTARGTHLGSLMRIPGTGRKIEVHGVSRLTVDGGKIRDAFYIWDVAGMLRGLGLLPDL